jgi:APA family basic amino acid/polyamine antiporter
VYFGVFAFFLGVPVYIWMKAQRGEYGESPVTPIDYPADSPYSFLAGNHDGIALTPPSGPVAATSSTSTS